MKKIDIVAQPLIKPTFFSLCTFPLSDHHELVTFQVAIITVGEIGHPIFRNY